MSVRDWLDERTNYRALMRYLGDQPMRGGASFAYVWGSALALSFLTQGITGWLLMTSYAPSATTAWASVAHISYTMKAGWLVRGLHHYGAQATIVLLALHLAQTAVFGAYRKPREMNWLLGLGLLFVTLGFGLTGYLLPWDQKGYWATRVATSIISTVPFIGGGLQRLLMGGGEYGHMTLTRFYSLHVGLLPISFIALMAIHVALFRKHGVTARPGADLNKTDRFYPKQFAMDAAAALVVLGVLFAVVLKNHGAHLDAPADPASDYPARPEWYFRFLFELFNQFHGSFELIGAVGLPVFVFGYLGLLPFIDKKADQGLKARLLVLAPLAFVALSIVGLTVKSFRSDAANEVFQQSRKLADTRAQRAAELFAAGVPPEGPLAMMRSDPQTRGPELFAAQCASCHQMGDLKPPEGKLTGPDLSDFGSKAWAMRVMEAPDADNMFGNTPFKGMMPSMTKPPADPEAAKFFTAMTAKELEAAASFLEAQSKGERAEGSEGETIIKRRCTSCHRLDGKTDDEDSLAPELRGWASRAWIEAQLENPAGGKTYPAILAKNKEQGMMPAYEDKLSAAERKLLTAWMLSQLKR